MKKRMLSIILTLCLILTMFMSVPVYAAGSVTINKITFTAGEAGKATVTGLSQEEIDYGAYLGIAPKGSRDSYDENYMPVANLPANNIWEFEAPYQLGDYEIRLKDGDGNVIARVSFTVGAPKAKEGDIKISKSAVKISEPMSVTVNGLTDEMIENDAWLGIEKTNVKMQNTVWATIIRDLPADNTYKFNAPIYFGQYEIRVFSDGVTDDLESVLFGTVPFVVESSKAQPGDIVLSKTSVYPDEKLSVTVNGLTQGEIENDAWIGLAKVGDRLENTIINTYIRDLPVNNTYEFTAPYEPGTYEIRVFCSGIMEPEEYEYGKFGTAQFIVSGEAASTGEIQAGYEDLSGWAAPEVNEAKNENLVTDKVMVDFPADITREEFCELAVLLYEKMTGSQAAPVASNPFSDTSNPEILKAYNLKIVNGTSATTFAPNNKVTRQEISAMLLRTLQAVMPNLVTAAEFKTTFHDTNNVASWALSAVKFMNANGILNGSTLTDGTSYILPKGNTTKEQAILMILRAYNAFYKI